MKSTDHKPKTHFQTPHSNTLKVQTHWNTLNQTLLLTQTSLRPLKLTWVNHLVWNFQNHSLSHINQSLKQFPLSVLLSLTHRVEGTLSFYSIHCPFCFLDSSLSFSSFRFWNFMMLPMVFRFSISDLFGFWWFMFGFWEKKIEVLGWKWSFVISMKNVYYFVWLFGKWVNKKNDFFLTNWAFELLLWN